MNKIQVETYARHQIGTRLKDLGWKMRETDGFEVVVQKEGRTDRSYAKKDFRENKPQYSIII